MSYLGYSESTHMEDYNCFCVTCGWIIGLQPDEETPGVQEWWKAILVRVLPTHSCDEGGCELRHNGDGQTIETINAGYTEGGPNTFFDPSLNDRPSLRKYYSINDTSRHDGHPWLGVHSKCLEIAGRFVNSQRVNREMGKAIASDPDAGIVADTDVEVDANFDVDDYRGRSTTLGRLYEMYRRRMIRQENSEKDHLGWTPFPLVKEEHNYFGFASALWGDDGQWEEGLPGLAQFEAAPFPLIGLTEEILSYLTPIPTEGQPSPILDSLPSPAALDKIITQFSDLENPTLAPERSIPPSAWREMLFSARVLPWLWDLDSTVLKSMPPDSNGQVEKYDANGVWDWELLVRQLAQVEVFQEGNLMANVQLGLRNRRRIWRVLEAVRMVDPYGPFKAPW